MNIDKNKVYTGIVIKFDKIKGFGYIKPEDTELSENIFCHFSDIDDNPHKFNFLLQKQKIKFNIKVIDKNNYKAVNIKKQVDN